VGDKGPRVFELNTQTSLCAPTSRLCDGDVLLVGNKPYASTITQKVTDNALHLMLCAFVLCQIGGVALTAFRSPNGLNGQACPLFFTGFGFGHWLSVTPSQCTLVWSLCAALFPSVGAIILWLAIWDTEKEVPGRALGWRSGLIFAGMALWSVPAIWFIARAVLL